ncbi:MAG: hypothetical protein HY062_07105 [Bacteroidetes bacterium]|nr:hypothetical protein [Bacteroidota bacterium]
MNNSLNFLHFFTKRLRLSNPWNFKIPFLITIPYLVFYISDSENTLKFPVFYILISIAVIVGVAGIGYLTNDLGDKEKDRLQNKPNATEKLTPLYLSALFILFITLTFAPWVYLPFNRMSAFLLVTEILLFLMYAFPPFRLKEKKIAGVIADALYAHVLPAILASYTFYILTNCNKRSYLFLIFTLCSWQFALGVRNILFHQIQDFNNDLYTQTHTFVTDNGMLKSETIVKRILLTEIITFLAFVAFCTYVHIWLGIFVCLFWLITYVKQKKLTEKNYRQYAYMYLDDLYIKWFPLFILLLLCLNNSHIAKSI